MIFTRRCPDETVEITKLLDSTGRLFTCTLHEGHCLPTKSGLLLKDLRLIRKRDISRILVVDSIVQSYGFYIPNLIPLIEWNGEKDDTELSNIFEYLRTAAMNYDIVEWNEQSLNIIKILELSADQV
jgi:TFIIF-interacting CTD phosphatase-like protein